MKQRMLCRTLTDFGVLCQFKSEEKQNGSFEKSVGKKGKETG